MKKKLFTAFIAIIAIGIFDPFSGAFVLNAQDTKTETKKEQ